MFILLMNSPIKIKLYLNEPDQNSQDKIAESIHKKSKALVFWILEEQLSNREEKVYSKRFFNRYNWVDEIDEIIESKSLWKIMEMAFISYFLENNLWVVSTQQLDKFSCVDFIFKIWNIKIWIDITCLWNESEKLNYKLNRINQRSYLIDHPEEKAKNEDMVSVSRDVDLIWCVNFDLSLHKTQEIITSFTLWKQNNYFGYWTDFLKNKKNIDLYLQTLTQSIHELLQISHIPSSKSFNKIEKLWWYNHILRNKSDLQINLYNTGKSKILKDTTLQFHLFYTQKYCDKIWISADIARSSQNIPKSSNVSQEANARHKKSMEKVNNFARQKRYSKFASTLKSIFKSSSEEVEQILTSQQLEKIKT